MKSNHLLDGLTKGSLYETHNLGNILISSQAWLKYMQGRKLNMQMSKSICKLGSFRNWFSKNVNQVNLDVGWVWWKKVKMWSREDKTWTGFTARALPNSADLDRTPQNTASELGVHCLFKLQTVQGNMKQSCTRSELFFQSTFRDNRPISTVSALIP